jgi:hypothetical protein
MPQLWFFSVSAFLWGECVIQRLLSKHRAWQPLAAFIIALSCQPQQCQYFALPACLC